MVQGSSGLGFRGLGYLLVGKAFFEAADNGDGVELPQKATGYISDSQGQILALAIR